MIIVVIFAWISLFFSCITSKHNSMRLILGSGSMSRRKILNSFSIKFDFVPAPDIDEESFLVSVGTSNLDRLVTEIAIAKSNAILERPNSNGVNGILLTADSVVVHNGEVLNKPSSSQEATNFLRRYSRDICTVVSSLILTDFSTKKRVQGVRRTSIHFKELPEATINDLVSEGKLIHCAGGLMVEHPLLQDYITLEGEIECAMGLSVDLLKQLWKELSDSDIPSSVQ